MRDAARTQTRPKLLLVNHFDLDASWRPREPVPATEKQ